MVEKMKNEIRNRKNIFWFLTVGMTISLGLYIYFVSHTIHSVVLRQKAEKSLSALQTDIEKLEADYFELRKKITPELAKSKGFTDISSAVFISSKPLGTGLSVNNEI